MWASKFINSEAFKVTDAYLFEKAFRSIWNVDFSVNCIVFLFMLT